MLCRLYGSVDASLSELSWVLLMSAMIEEGEIFNWEEILSSNFTQQIRACREESPERLVGFFTLDFLLDVVCAVLPFHAMNFQWMIDHSPVHIYFFNYGIQGLDTFL